MTAGGGLALLLAAYALFDAWADHRQARRSLAESRAALDEMQGRVRALESRPGSDQSVAMQALLTLDAPPPRVVAELAALLPSDVKLDALSLEYALRLTVQMQVAARHRGAYDVFLERLEASPLFADILPGEENREGEVRAMVRASYRLAGP